MKIDKQKIWNVFRIILWFGACFALLFVFGFADKRESEVLCRKIKIEIDQKQDNYFIDKSDVNQIIHNTNDILLEKPLIAIDIDSMERSLNKNPYIENAQVYSDLTGAVQVSIKQRKPILRIINNNYRSFYVDDRGLKMPLSDHYSAHVLVANGNIKEGYGGIIDSLQTDVLQDLYLLTQFILKDEFWTAQIVQIYVDDNKDLVLIPRVGNHKIILGDISDLELKFGNLLIFYNKAMPRVGWNTYSSISLKFKNQVVCTKWI